ncbi:hypothetical protein JWZ98_22730 (plasmid) [Methylomonas sp. EFPC1]|uniref:Bacterial mobilisation domain-containing protein n=1 Tax=Methylomonas rosea TaxID=2952227 RepID=A0ABT1TUR3_9GAMM|nr:MULTISPECIES: hypothetical protein [unclassified Methylomonas]MCQ8118506.1 hypothetical protein [Methylomonas sp. WSC-7]PPD24629.1 MAG: hypothetical protein CTY24_00130 [Methylobacter sp.]QSB03804.1 hypothetical protein JWZ98_22730 [Methylomonas sp. EFPC1]
MAKIRTVALNIRILPAKKAALIALAEKRRTDVTKLILPEIDRLLNADAGDFIAPPDVATDDELDDIDLLNPLISFMPLPGDKRHTIDYAATRMMKLGTVMKLILRGWITKNAPMPREELAALAVTSNQLAALGRNLNQLVKLAHAGHWPDSNELVDMLTETMQMTTQASAEIDAVVRTNLMSWENEDA